MRLINELGNEVNEEECDLDKGRIVETTWANPAAYDTIDNETKFALDDDDYERVLMYRPYTDMDYQASRLAEREAWLAGAPEQAADLDEAVVELYEAQAQAQLDTDEALTALYEAILANGRN